MSDGLESLRQTIERADAALVVGGAAAPTVYPTGFDPLDTYLSGGLRGGELTLIGGAQGVGKTTFALQVLRNIVAAGGKALYFSYEHDPETLLAKIIGIEAACQTFGAGFDGITMRQLREVMENAQADMRPLRARVARLPGGGQALDAVYGYGERFQFVRATTTGTELATIRRHLHGFVEGHFGPHAIVVIDYLQKVAAPGVQPLVEAERVTLVVEGLKDLALEFSVPVVAIVAASAEGIAPGARLRIHHLRGSTALAYEADVVLLLNEKFNVVARHHLVYDVGNADRFKSCIVVSLEKNRSGIAGVDLEFRKRFDQGHIESVGDLVPERLLDERIFTE
jgi:replicative DNA helicase